MIRIRCIVEDYLKRALEAMAKLPKNKPWLESSSALPVNRRAPERQFRGSTTCLLRRPTARGKKRARSLLASGHSVTTKSNLKLTKSWYGHVRICIGVGIG